LDSDIAELSETSMSWLRPVTGLDWQPARVSNARVSAMKLFAMVDLLLQGWIAEARNRSTPI
jgi:hypothetical protein